MIRLSKKVRLSYTFLKEKIKRKKGSLKIFYFQSLSLVWVITTTKNSTTLKNIE